MSDDGEVGPLPGGYHDRISDLINELMPLCEKAFLIADEFGEDDNSSLTLEGGIVKVTIKRNE